MASGLFFGGVANGFQRESALTNQANYEQGLLQLAQQREKNLEQQQQRAEYMQLRSDGISHIEETIKQLKIAHPDWGPMQLASNPAIVSQKNMLAQFSQNLGIPNDLDSIVAQFAERPSETSVKRAESSATGELQLRQSEAAKNQAQAEAIKQNSASVAGNETVDFYAQQLLEGNQNVLSGFSRSVQGVAIRMKIQQRAAELAKEQNLSPSDVNANVAEFMGQKAGASALGRREAQVIGAATTATKTAPRVLETSDKVDRTKYPSLNSAILAYEQGTGDENVIRFGIAVTTFVNNYARALGAGNQAVTDAARKEATSLLSTSYSKGQVGAAVDQMLNKELPSEISGAKSGMKTFLNTTGTGKSKPQYKFNPDTGELE